MCYLRATLTQVLTRVRAGGPDVSLRDVTIARDGKRGQAGANDVTHRKRAEDFRNLKKVSRVEMRPASGEDGWLSLARGGLGQMSHETGGGQMKKNSIERLCLSPYVETFLLKGNKRFRTRTEKSLRVFRISRFLCSMYICSEHPIYISHIHVYG